MNEVEEAKEVLLKESKSISGAAEKLDSNFLKALNILNETSEKIIVCGIGKSGHVAKKLAATFCSTGSTATFLHASEAVHGDLGVHKNGDAVIFFSNSSSTPELLTLEPIIRKRGGKIIGILGNKNGPLVSKVNVFIDASVEIEADPLGIVPTASFMVAAALGDALAVGLMKRKNFSEEDYALTHPAGQLGRNLLYNVDDVMHKIDRMAIVSSHTPIRELVLKMTKFPLGAACVIENKKLIGFVTDGDLRRALSEYKNLLEMKTHSIMSINPQTIYPKISLGKALKIMEEGPKQISVLPVLDIDSNNVIGMIRLHDIYNPKS
jgi:arabinose-5-phosphate isomerase